MDEQAEKSHRYGTRHTNKDFKVLDHLQVLQSPPKRKKRATQSKKAPAKKKLTKEEKKLASSRKASEIAELEDQHVRTQKEKREKHPRHLQEITLNNKEITPTISGAPQEVLDKKSASDLAKLGVADCRNDIPARIRRKTQPSNTTRGDKQAKHVTFDPETAVEVQTEHGQPVPTKAPPLTQDAGDDLLAFNSSPSPPPRSTQQKRSKKRCLVASDTDEAIGEGETACDPQTPALKKQKHTTTVLETPGQVPSEDESDGDVRTSPDDDLAPVYSYSPNDEGFHVGFGQSGYVNSPWNHSSPPFSKPAYSAAETPLVTHAKEKVAKGKMKEKEVTLWDEIKQKRREKNEISNDIISINSTPDITTLKRHGGLAEDWRSHVTSQNFDTGTSSAQSRRLTVRPRPVAATSKTTETSTSRTTKSTSTTIGPIRSSLAKPKKLRRGLQKPYNRPLHQQRGHDKHLKPGLTQRGYEATSNQNLKPSQPRPGYINPPLAQNGLEDSASEDGDVSEGIPFATKFGGLGEDNDLREENTVKATPAKVDLMKRHNQIKIEAASPLPIARRRRRNVNIEDQIDDEAVQDAPVRSKALNDKLPPGTASNFATFLRAVVKAQGAYTSPDIWFSYSPTTIPVLQKLWDNFYGKDLIHVVGNGDSVCKGADKKLAEWRSIIGTSGLASTHDYLTSKNLNTSERKSLATTLIDDHTWLFGPNDSSGVEREMFYGPLVQMTYSHHLSMIEDAVHPAEIGSLKLEFQHGGVALCAAAVSRALKLWSKGHITVEAIEKAKTAIEEAGNAGELTKHKHLTRAIKPVGEATRKSLEFNAENYKSTTYSLSLKAKATFNTLTKMRSYNDLARSYSTIKKPRRVADRKISSELSGDAAAFFDLPLIM